MNAPSAEAVRSFVAEHLADSFKENGVDPSNIADDFDLMKSGIIDSIGLINLIGAIEERFDIEVDFEELDPESITVLGPLARYMAERAGPRHA